MSIDTGMVAGYIWPVVNVSPMKTGVLSIIWKGADWQSGLPDPPSGVPDPQSGLPDSQSGVPDPQSGLPDPQSGVPDPQSGLPDPQSGVPDSQSGVPDPQSGLPDFKEKSSEMASGLLSSPRNYSYLFSNPLNHCDYGY